MSASGAASRSHRLTYPSTRPNRLATERIRGVQGRWWEFMTPDCPATYRRCGYGRVAERQREQGPHVLLGEAAGGGRRLRERGREGEVVRQLDGVRQGALGTRIQLSCAPSDAAPESIVRKVRRRSPQSGGSSARRWPRTPWTMRSPSPGSPRAGPRPRAAVFPFAMLPTFEPVSTSSDAAGEDVQRVVAVNAVVDEWVLMGGTARVLGSMPRNRWGSPRDLAMCHP